jgi:hypothetical protein
MHPRRSAAIARTFEQLERLVRQLLCSKDRLDPQETPLKCTPLRRRNAVCGVLFVLHGPRRLRSLAIWVCEEHRVLCYDSAGTRFAEIHLAEAPLPPA